MSMDKRGVPRGSCSCGECDAYVRPTEGQKCEYCECVPVKHADLRKDDIIAPLSSSKTPVQSDDRVTVKAEQDCQPDEGYLSHLQSAPNSRTDNNGTIHTQPSKLSVPEVGSSSDLARADLSSAHRPKANDRKRHASDPGMESESKQRKQKQQAAMSSKHEKASIPQIEMKPCKLLHKGHVPYTEMYRSKGGSNVKGVFKIAYDWKTIYIGRSSECVFKQIRRQFNPSGQAELYQFLKGLDKTKLEKVSVFWLDENEHTHTCKKSYLHCIEKLQGEKPRFRGRNVPGRNRSKSSPIENETLGKVRISFASGQNTDITHMGSSAAERRHQTGDSQRKIQSVKKQKLSSESSEEVHSNTKHSISTTTKTPVKSSQQLDSTRANAEGTTEKLKKAVKVKSPNREVDPVRKVPPVIKSKGLTGGTSQNDAVATTTKTAVETADQGSGQIIGHTKILLEKHHSTVNVCTILPRSTEFIERVSKEKVGTTRPSEKPLHTTTKEGLSSGLSSTSAHNTVIPDTAIPDWSRSGREVSIGATIDKRQNGTVTCDRTKNATTSQAKSNLSQQGKPQLVTTSKGEAEPKDSLINDKSLLANIMKQMDASSRSRKQGNICPVTESKQLYVLQSMEGKNKPPKKGHLELLPNRGEVKKGHLELSQNRSEVKKDSEPKQLQPDHRNYEMMVNIHQRSSGFSGGDMSADTSETEDQLVNFETSRNREHRDDGSFQARSHSNIRFSEKSFSSLEVYSVNSCSQYPDSHETEVAHNRRRSTHARSNQSQHERSRSRYSKGEKSRRRESRHRRHGNRERKDRADGSRFSSSHPTNPGESSSLSTRFHVSCSKSHTTDSIYSNSDDDLPEIHPPRFIKDYRHLSSRQ